MEGRKEKWQEDCMCVSARKREISREEEMSRILEVGGKQEEQRKKQWKQIVALKKDRNKECARERDGSRRKTLKGKEIKLEMVGN